MGRYTLSTVSLEKCLGSKGKQNYKHTVSVFRDADPQPVIPPNEKKNHGMSPKLLTPGIHISLTTTDPCLPSTTWKCSYVYHFRSSQGVD